MNAYTGNIEWYNTDSSTNRKGYVIVIVKLQVCKKNKKTRISNGEGKTNSDLALPGLGGLPGPRVYINNCSH